jgi:CMP-N-acetylneuraminic acid synthetase
LKPKTTKKGYKSLCTEEHTSYCLGDIYCEFPSTKRVTQRQQWFYNNVGYIQFPQRSQDLKKIWHNTRTLYFSRVSVWEKEKFTVNASLKGIRVLPSQRQDIDEKQDWSLAEMEYKIMREHSDG